MVDPSVSRAAVLHGTALTAFVETPSGATVFSPGPIDDCGNGPVEYGVGGVPGALRSRRVVGAALEPRRGRQVRVGGGMPHQVKRRAHRVASSSVKSER